MTDNNIFDIEESFFKISNFKKHFNILHNLNNWHIKIEGWENKAGQIETYVIVPYAEMSITLNETYNDNKVRCSLCRKEYLTSNFKKFS